MVTCIHIYIERERHISLYIYIYYTYTMGAQDPPNIWYKCCRVYTDVQD